MTFSRTASTFLTALLAFLMTAGSVGAATVAAGSVSWDSAPGFRQVLTVSGAGQVLRFEFKAGEAPYFEPYDLNGNTLPDGTYNWQIVAEPAVSKTDKAALAEARRRGDDLADQAAELLQSGAFTLAGGLFVTGAEEGGATKDQVFVDDLIVDGSACVGTDCVNGENFGFDTLRLKENNLRIKFEDTSASASFPSNDWQLTANDSNNGGLNKFSIDDITGGKTPFIIEAGAASHSIYVESDGNQGGNVGLGTSTPAVDLHVVSGNSPTLRLEQDGSSGFTAHTWDIAGNETNFFIRDVTNSSKLPFRIKPGAPDNSIFIAADGDVGLGTQSPDTALHLKRNNGTAVLRVEDSDATVADRDLVSLVSNGGQIIRYIDTAGGVFWATGNNQSGDYIIDGNAGAGNELTLSGNGDLTITGSLTTATGNTCQNGCDRVFQSEYELESIKEHAAYMWENSHLAGVGPTPEDPSAPFDVTRKTAGILNELEKAHIYIEQLHDGLESKDARITSLEERLARLEALVAE